MIIECLVVSVLAVQPPTANDFELNTNEDTAVDGQVDAQPAVEGGALSYKVRRGPLRGTVTVNPTTGAIHYEPAAEKNGDDSFVVQVTEGKLSSSAKILVHVIPVNDAPVAQPLKLTTNEDTPASGQVKASDIDADSLTYSVKKAPAHGQATIDEKSGAFTFKPAENFNGADGFTIDVNDGTASAVVEVSVTVNAVNDAPTAEPQSFSLNEDAVLDEAVTAADIDADALTYAVLEKPKHGEATIDASTGKLHYAPAKDFHGDDALRVTAADAKLKVTIPIAVQVKPVNDAPVAKALMLTLAEDSATKGQVSASDVDRNSLSYSIKSPAAHGEAAVDAKTGAVTYKGAPDFNGADAFVVEVSDGALTATADVTVQVSPVNDAPTAEALNFSLDEDLPLDEQAKAADVDQDTLSYAITEKPKHGEATIDAASGKLHYAPAKDFHGDDGLKVTVTDGKLKATAAVSLTVKAVNDAPVAQALALSLAEDGSTAGKITAADVDKDPLSYVAKAPAAHGEVTIDSKTGAVTYRPEANFSGPDSFSVEVSDGRLTAVAEVAITVTAVNDAPTAEALSVSLDEDVPLDEQVKAADVDQDTLTYSILEKPKHGEASLDAASGKLHYVPAKDFNGDDGFKVSVTDGKLKVTVPISLTVKAVNDVPVAQGLSLSLAEDGSTAGKITASDVDKDTLTYLPKGPAAHGEVTIDSKTGAVTYRPEANFNGTDAFSVEVTDGRLSAIAEVAVKVTAVNDAPVATGASLTTDEDVGIDAQCAAEDLDGDTLTYSLSAKPKHGEATLDPASGKLHFTPAKDFHGDDALSFTVTDGKLRATAQLTLTINPVNDSPVSQPLSLATAEDGPVKGKLGASDVDRDELMYSVKKAPGHGETTIDAKSGEVSFSPAKDFNGEDSFELEVSDGRLSATTVVPVKVAAVNDAPVATAAEHTTAEDVVLEQQCVASDVDGDTLTYGLLAPPKHGQATIDNATGMLRFVPAKDFHGSDALAFVVSDGKLKSNATIKLEMTAVNDSPVAKSLSLSCPEDGSTKGKVTASDLDGDALTYSVRTQPGHGEATVDAKTGAVTYKPAPDFNGTDSFVVEASDGQLAAAATVTVSVSSVSEPPRIRATVLEASEDVTLEKKLPAEDPDGDALSFHLLTQAKLGTVTLVDAKSGLIRYVPKPDISGDDEVGFDVSDGYTTVKGSVKIRVAPVNDMPTVQPLELKTKEDVAVDGQLIGADIDRDALTYAIVGNPKAGKAVLVDAKQGGVRFTPDLNQNGEASFTVTVSDGKLTSAPVPVVVRIEPQNDAPVAENASANTDEDTAVNVTVKATDIDADVLKYQVGRKPLHGVARVVDAAKGLFSYTPAENFSGSDSFLFQAVDTGGASSTATVTVTIKPIDDAPIGVVSSYSSPFRGTFQNRLQGYDREGSPVTFRIVEDPPAGRLELLDKNTGEFTYTAEGTVSGKVVFKFEVSDGKLTSDPVEQPIEVRGH